MLALFSGLATGLIAGFVLQLVLAQLVPGRFALYSGSGWDTGGLLILAAAVAVLAIPALRRAGSGFVLGLVLGGVTQLAFFAWLLSTLS